MTPLVLQNWCALLDLSGRVSFFRCALGAEQKGRHRSTPKEVRQMDDSDFLSTGSGSMHLVWLPRYPWSHVPNAATNGVAVRGARLGCGIKGLVCEGKYGIPLQSPCRSIAEQGVQRLDFGCDSAVAPVATSELLVSCSNIPPPDWILDVQEISIVNTQKSRPPTICFGVGVKG